jgi:uncharacterized membrane protein
MSELSHIIEKRKLLVAQSALQRAMLAQEIVSWQPRLAWVDRGIAAGRYLQRYPAALAVTGLLVAALRPHRAARWLERGWVLWQIGRRLWRSRQK